MSASRSRMVVADNRYVAEDAAALVAVSITSRCRRSPIAARRSRRARRARIATRRTTSPPHSTMGYGDVDAAFAARGACLPRRRSGSIAAAAIRWNAAGIVVADDAIEERLTIWSSTQTPHARAAACCARCWASTRRQLRVVTPDVGGGFGPKLVFYPEDVAVAVGGAACWAGR